ncbi:MAG: hypothetical protein L0Z55_06415 [Planctomycetes bacterium]|nr:hypothetical protein [Planctomycetota bacterium]
MDSKHTASCIALLGATCILFCFPPAAAADTVFLKNGAAIDCTVLGTHEGKVILRIGNVGRTEIAELEIENIEKNDRTGYVDPGRAEIKRDERIDVPGQGPKNGKPKGGTGRDGQGSGGDGEGKDGEADAIDPELEREIKEAVDELTRQRTTNRVRAERRLTEIGVPAIPYLIPISHHPFDRTRIAVFRLFKKHGGPEVVESCLTALEDTDPFVRKLAWETLKRVSGKSWEFPWDDESASAAQRSRSVTKWRKWWTDEKARAEADAAARGGEKADAEAEDGDDSAKKAE